MDKAVIIDGFDFLSFHLCKAILGKGFEVEGINIQAHHRTQFLEEKRLEVGRNANFSDYSFADWGKSSINNSNTTMIISIYDFFTLRKESILAELDFHSVLKAVEKNKNPLVILAPIQMVTDSDNKGISAFSHQAEDLVKDLKIVYLPTVYGPWQPVDFLFQRVISEQIKNNIQPSNREWTGDAIFVEDAAESIMHIIEAEQPGQYILESGRENAWEECARQLGVEQSNWQSSIYDVPETVTRIPLKKRTNITEALVRLRDHTNRVSYTSDY
ncbi:Rossmann-fold NAD(P)-binding domain-containing protein [Neobacillus dielmonensis]|uniref:hypothetical protein n=1 Tax=Neobacillus dielmonensis TaxID=1347369 RepID=UPI0005A97A9B|nr:hypothetical protein [Neobacillus dielmonensis]